ncbi:MAG: ester cyclase [Pseudomonadota bacterium]
MNPELPDYSHILDDFYHALSDCDRTKLHQTINHQFHDDCTVHLAHPFEDLTPQGLFLQAYSSLFSALPDLEHRQIIKLSGFGHQQSRWIGVCGYFCGTFMGPWLDIPPTGHFVTMRTHEFFRIQDDKIVEMQALWDIPHLMMQASA